MLAEINFNKLPKKSSGQLIVTAHVFNDDSKTNWLVSIDLQDGILLSRKETLQLEPFSKRSPFDSGTQFKLLEDGIVIGSGKILG